MTVQLKLKQAAAPQRAEVQRMLYALTGVNLSAEEAWAVLPRIENHKWYVSERLGRDVGLRVAAVDFLENIYEARRVRARRVARWIKQLAGELWAGHLTHLAWQAQEGVFGRGPQPS